MVQLAGWPIVRMAVRLVVPLPALLVSLLGGWQCCQQAVARVVGRPASGSLVSGCQSTSRTPGWGGDLLACRASGWLGGLLGELAGRVGCGQTSL